jgi:hypothetical protein
LKDVFVSEYEIIFPGIPVIDGCQLFKAVKVFVVKQGVESTLQSTLRTRTGAAVNLYTLAGLPTPDGTETETSVADALTITVRFREAIAGQVTTLTASIVDAAEGEVSVALESDQVAYAGVFTLEWVVSRDSKDVLVHSTKMPQ